MSEQAGRSILFMTPPYHCGVVEVAGRWLPLSLVYLAGSARDAGWQAVIYDAMTKQHDWAAIESRLAKESYDVLAVTAITASWPTGPTWPDPCWGGTQRFTHLP